MHARSFQMAPPISVPVPKQVKKCAKSSKSVRSSKALGEPPAPPEGVSYPADFRHKRCKRCGVWSCAAAPYNQLDSMEFAWGKVIAWEQGSIFAPAGSHCLLCRKAGMVGLFVNPTQPEVLALFAAVVS